MDFFLTQGGGSGARKKENLFALYSIIEYCEEPYLCRRMMQLQFLGEDFDPDECKNMCDNCRTNLKISHRDLTKEAIKVAQVSDDIQMNRGKITLSKLCELAKGST